MAQHPLFLELAEAWREGRFDVALARADALLAEYPGNAALRWHRARCLEQLGRKDELGAELRAVLEARPDFAPALVMRVKHDPSWWGGDEDDDGEERSDAEQERHDAALAARMDEASRRAEHDLRRALEQQPDDVEAISLLASVLRLRQGEDDDARACQDEAARLLDRAIALAPDRIDLLEERVSARQSAAFVADGEESEGEGMVSTWSGMRFRTAELEGALADLERCLAMGGQPRHAVRMGRILHDLGRYDEALARYDEALAAMDPDDPARGYVQEMREASEGGGAGEREQMARLLESVLVDEGKDRSLEDDMGAQAILGAAAAVRRGKRLEEALDARLSDDEDTLVATSIAQQILNLAYEPPPGLAPADASGYPAYQRRFIRRTTDAATAIGLRHVADAEAQGLFAMLGQHVLIGFFADETGEIGVAAYAIRPKRPRWHVFLLLVLMGKWKTVRMLECSTQFDDGTLLSTRLENASPFEYGGAVRDEFLPRGASLADLVARHRERVAAHRAEHPGAVAMVARDLGGMERRWVEGQAARRAWRESVDFVTDAELRRMLGAQHARFGERVRAQLRLLAADYG